MDWSTLFSGLMGNQAPQPGQPTSGAPGAPMNIVPQGAQPPTGILNGQPAPQQPGQGGQNQLLQQAQKLMAPPAAPPQMSPIQMAKPVGAQGIDPTKLLAAMQQNRLMNA